MPQAPSRHVQATRSHQPAALANFDDEHWAEHIHGECDWETRVAMMDLHLRLLSEKIDALRDALK